MQTSHIYKAALVVSLAANAAQVFLLKEQTHDFEIRLSNQDAAHHAYRAIQERRYGEVERHLDRLDPDWQSHDLPSSRGGGIARLRSR